jgi:hypothetical protein
MNDVKAHPDAELCMICNKALERKHDPWQGHDHGVKVVPSPKGPRPTVSEQLDAIAARYEAEVIASNARIAALLEEQTLRWAESQCSGSPKHYGGCGCHHVEENTPEVSALKETIKELRAIIWPGAILEHHYGGSKNKPHNGLLPGDLVETCTGGYCPQWWRIYKEAGKIL